MTKSKSIYYACVLSVFTWLIAQGSEAAAPKEMVSIPTGCFQMGSERGDKDEKPAHEVCLDAFFMDKYEVTQEKFEKILGKNPSKFRGAQHPVQTVTWYEAKEYCIKVGKRLPSEAEWEYAARAGSNMNYYWGDAMQRSHAWFISNSDYKAHNVGLKKPNAWGLYDMSGNVWEWVQDWWDNNTGYYKIGPKYNPKGPVNSFEKTHFSKKILRGGSWANYSEYVRTANRGKLNPTIRSIEVGFRCAK
jgi:formylglycine-generating enzyme required for sulfatase activity